VLVRFPNYYETVIIPKLIDTDALENTTPAEARAVIKKRIGAQKRAAQRIIAKLEQLGYIRREPAQPSRIHIIKREKEEKGT